MKTGNISPLASLLFATALVTGGCLQKETSHTICVEPDGSVTWTVIERDVHATGDTPWDRLREEEDYLSKAWTGQHPAALAFGALHAFDVRTDIFDDEWPFAVRVRGRFPDFAVLWQDILRELAMAGRSEVEREGARVIWTLTASAEGTTTETDQAEAVQSLFAGGPLRIFIRHGRFVEAVGFDISDDDRVATMNDDVEEDTAKGEDGAGVVRLSLTWTDGEKTAQGS